MFLLSNLTKRVTAASFLVAFLNVFVGQCLCAAIMPTARAHKTEAVKAAKPTHPGCHGHGAAKAGKTAGKQHAPAKPGHGCCKDNSAAVLKGLATPPVEKLAAAGPLWVALPPVQDFTFAAGAAWAVTQAVCLVPPQHLPPKIPDIRIFVGSLTI